jgi:hypothetical protein
MEKTKRNICMCSLLIETAQHESQKKQLNMMVHHGKFIRHLNLLLYFFYFVLFHVHALCTTHKNTTIQQCNSMRDKRNDDKQNIYNFFIYFQIVVVYMYVYICYACRDARVYINILG